MAELGHLERVDVRSVWCHEAHDFTPWLVENIQRVGDVLGMELEVVQREHAIGDFSLDILARDVGRDCLVAIENQLEPTDHMHLGQLITYGAGTEARTVVWVTPRFREEHRQALDWLNRGLEGSVDFFGIAVECVRIDDSRPAINLRVVASPNHWSKTRRTVTSGELTEKGATQVAFFQPLIDELREEHRFTNARAAQPQNWYAFTAGKTGLSYVVTMANDGRLRVDLTIDFPDRDANVALFNRLREERAEIEAEVGEPLDWDVVEGRRSARIAVYRPALMTDPDDQRAAHRRWAVERLLRFKRVLGPHLK